jgi:hypothetical protein
VGERVLLEERLNAAVHEDVLHPGLGEECLEQGPGPGAVEVGRRGPPVPDGVVQVVVTQIDVSPGLVALVRLELATLLRAEVTDKEHGRVGELFIHAGDRVLHELDRLARAPHVIGIDLLP